MFAFGIGLVFGYCFDTTGPRREVVAARDDDSSRAARPRRRAADVDGDGVHDADEPVTRDRAATDGEVPADDRDRVTTR